MVENSHIIHTTGTSIDILILINHALRQINFHISLNETDLPLRVRKVYHGESETGTRYSSPRATSQTGCKT